MGRGTRGAVAILALLGAAGCNSGSGGRSTFETGESVGPMTAGMTTDTDTDTDGTAGTVGTDTMATTAGPVTTNDPTLDETETSPDTDADTDADTDPGTDTEPGETTGDFVVPCVGVDFLFLVDNSVGMADEQTRIQATAFAFVSQVAQQAATALGNIRVAVLTTDEPEFVVPKGGYTGGNNFMVWDNASADANATLQAELGAALLVGEGGDPNERPMDMLQEALTGPVANGFNADFLVEDAVLVVVLVTDEEDDVEQPTLWGSDGDPADWVEGVADIKEGIRKDIVVLSVVPDMSACIADKDATRLKEFTEAFPNSAMHDVCQPDYSAFLLGQVQTVANACMNFSPP